MRFLQLCADPGIAPGSTKGAAQHLRGIAAGLTALGHRVTTVAARRPEGLFPVEVAALDDLGETAAALRPDVIYERYSLGRHRLGLDLARELGVPHVLEVNAPLVAEATAHRPDTVPAGAAAAEAELLAATDLVVTVSSALTRWVDGLRAGPTITLVNGFEPSWFPHPAAAGEAGPLVFIGHPKPWHGADRLPALLAALAARGLDADLLVVGGGPGIEPILDEARRLGVADRIEVTGPLAPAVASARLAGAAIGLAPYRRQADFYFCPLKVVDYLAAGLPVVATDQGDIASLVATSGIVVDPDDDRALVDAVASLLADPTRRTVLGAAGRWRANATLTWEQVAARTVEAVEAVATRAPVRAAAPGVGS